MSSVPPSERFDASTRRVGPPPALSDLTLTVAQSATSPESRALAALERGEFVRVARFIEAAERKYLLDGDVAGRSRVARLTGIVLAELGAFDLALNELLSALEMAMSVSAQQELLAVRFSLSVVLSLDGPFDEAMRMADAALEMARDMKDRPSVANALINKSFSCWRLGAHDEGLQCIQLALRILGNAEGHGNKVLAYANLGRLLLGKGDLTRGRKYINLALEQARIIGNRRHQGLALAALARADTLSGNNPAALASILGAIDIFTRYGFHGRLPELYEQLAETYVAARDFQGAMQATRMQNENLRGRVLAQRATVLAFAADPSGRYAATRGREYIESVMSQWEQRGKSTGRGR